MEYDVTLTKTVVLTIEADSPEQARELALTELRDFTPPLTWEVTDVEVR